MSIEERLRQAIASGEVVKVIYHGGSQPGSMREIAPMTIKNGHVSARCYTSNAVKSFALEKLVVVDGEALHPAKEWRASLFSPKQYASIFDVLEKHKSALLQFGWHIENDQSHLSLHRKFKNGTPLKGSDVSLDYEEYSYDSVMGLDGQSRKENFRKRHRPWTVRGKNQDTKTVGQLDKAAAIFLEWAKLLAPLGK